MVPHQDSNRCPINSATTSLNYCSTDNIMLQNRSTFFHFEPPPQPEKCDKGRCSMKRYGRVYSDSLVRDLERTCDAMYIDEQIRPHEIPRTHDTCRGMAAVKWGPMKIGAITVLSFIYTRAGFPLTWEVRELIWSGKIWGILLLVRENDVLSEFL